MALLKSLRIFYLAAKHESITEAAQSMHIDRTAASRHIKRLEEEVGFSLLIRGPNDVKLSDKGLDLFPLVEQILNIGSDLIQKETQTSLRILITHSMLLYQMPEIIEQWTKANPDVSLDIKADDYLRNEDGDHFDVIVGPSTISRSDMASIQYEYDNTLGIYGHPSYFDRKGKPETLDELDNHDLIVFHGGLSGPLGIGSYPLYAGKKEGESPRRALVAVNSVATMLALCERGVGLIGVGWDKGMPESRIEKVFDIETVRHLPCYFHYKKSRRVQKFIDFVTLYNEKYKQSLKS